MAPTIQSPLPTMAPTSTPQGMSSRLMTMKFMQRGEASAKSSPGGSATPKSDNEGSASKRRKTTDADNSADGGKPLYDEAAVKAALDEDEAKRQAAVARRAKDLGDEQWVLNAAATISAPDPGQRTRLSFVQVGFAQIDSGFASDGDEPGSLAGRRQFNMKKGKKRSAPQTQSDRDSSDSDDESGSEDSFSSEEEARDQRGRRQSDGTPSGNRKRHSHSVNKKREAERIKAQELAEKRRKKEVKLNTLTSLSSGGAKNASFVSSAIKCYGCGQMGHSRSSCPSRRKSGS